MSTQFRISGLALGAVLFAPSIFPQTTSGSIAGSVNDPQDAAVAGATVTAREVEKSISVSTATSNIGRFVFAQIQPGRYTITVEAPGFKKYERTGIVLNANDEISVGAVRLELGDTLQTVEVHAQGAELKTESGERSDSIVGEQLQNIEVNGRSPLALLNLIPGVRNEADWSVAGHQMGHTFVNGSRNNQSTLSLDGGNATDNGNNVDQIVTVSLDSVQEFKVLTAAFQAQYGHSAGAQIILVTKSGTKDFHGSGYWFHRNEGLNANNWKNNRDGIQKPLFRLNNAGYTIGGPVFIPGKFNSRKEKLFFFWSQEYQHQIIPNGVKDVEMPTALERQGNFSQSVDGSGGKITIKDYSAGTPFPGNIIPPSRLWQPGVNILNIYPLPNDVSPLNKGFNYQSQISDRYPRREDLIRIDSNISDKWRMFSRFIHNADQRTSAYGFSALASNFPLVPINDNYPAYGFLTTVTAILNPTTTNEASFVIHHDTNNIVPSTNGLTRAATGLTGLNLLFPPQDDLIPQFNFGTNIGTSPSLTSGNAPFLTYFTSLEWIDNFSKVMNRHFLKAGIYVNRARKNATASSSNPYNPNGGVNFVNNASNPYDTSDGFANAQLGIFTSLNQASGKFVIGHYRYTNLEWFAQDTWKASSRLTLDYGVRFYWIQPQYDAAMQTSNFLPQDFSAANAVRLYLPACAAPGCKKVALNPITGQTDSDTTLIGTIIPNSGNVDNGLVQAGHGISKYLTQDRGFHAAPRFGLAYDLTGRHNLVFRTGFGAFFDRIQGNEIVDEIGNPPTAFSPVLQNGFLQTISSYLGRYSPSGLRGLSADGQVPAVYNYNAGIQARLPWAVVLDASYVGSISRHLLQTQDLNAIPYGATFLPQNQDPTKVAASPNALKGSNAYDQNFLATYQGWGSITVHEFGGASNYNSLQVSANRRFAKGLFMGIAYTWAKALGTVTRDNQTIRIDGLTRFANYGPLDFSVRHNFVLNYVYALPGLRRTSQDFLSRAARAVANNWQLSGLTVFQTGTPYSVNFGFQQGGVGSAQLTGSYTEAARINLIGNPLAGTTGSPYDRINAAAFAPPTVGSIGLGAGVNYMTGPGINNFNMSLQKNIPVRERLHMELRIDAFNTFNHTQFSNGTAISFNSPAAIHNTLNFRSLTDPTPVNLPFNANGTVNNINGFGTVVGARDARILQLVARVVF